MNNFISLFIEKEYRISIFSLFLFYFVVFGYPDLIQNKSDLTVIFFIFCFYILLQEFSNNRQVIDFIFKKHLIGLEIHFRKNGLKHEYYKLNEEYRNEIDKIDRCVNTLFSRYILSVSWILLFLLQIVLYKLKILQLNSLDFLHFSIPGWCIIIFGIFVNTINFVNFKNDFSQYVTNYEKIYSIYSGDKE